MEAPPPLQKKIKKENNTTVLYSIKYGMTSFKDDDLKQFEHHDLMLTDLVCVFLDHQGAV